MKTLKATIYWTKTGDMVPFRRVKNYELLIPTEKELSRVESAMISIPLEFCDASGTLQVNIEHPLDVLTDDIVVESIINETAKQQSVFDAKCKAQEEENKALEANKLEKISELTPCIEALLTAANGKCGKELLEVMNGSLAKKLIRVNNIGYYEDATRIPELASQTLSLRELTNEIIVTIRSEKDNAMKIASEERKANQEKEKLEWAFKNGSERLRELVLQGYSGRGLYYVERLAIDFKEAFLDKKADTLEVVLSPSLEALVTAKAITERLVELGQYPDYSTAINDVFIGKCGRDKETVVFDWYPGDDSTSEVWDKLSVRVDV